MSMFSKVAHGAAVTALLVSLTGCGGGGSDDPPQGANPPPPAAPAPTPTPPPPPPPPPPSSSVPPLSSVVTNLDADQQIGIDRWVNGNTATGGDGNTLQGVPCMTPATLPDNYHVHAHVSIIVDGVAQSVPANIGIVPAGPNGRCFYLVHTHDKSGLIHMEADAPTTFTLGQVFAIWGQPLETDNVAGLTGKPISVYTVENATVTQVTTDWKAIELPSKKLVTIVVGTPVAEIPNFSWSSN
jgi:hypothetical protein